VAAELYIGLMSGTSADGIDAALVDFSGQPRLLATSHFPFPAELQARIRAVRRDSPLYEVATLDALLGERFADAALTLLRRSGHSADDIRAIGSHGQTVWHEPNGAVPFTLQIGDPNLIAERTGITTIADFRRRDVAAGGQGAPLVPAFHAEVFGSASEDRCVLNLGGIANITVLPAGAPERTLGFDTGPANTLLDAWIGRHRGERYDRDGVWAARGRIIPELLAKLLDDDYFRQAPPKSTGPERFNLDWLDTQLASLAAAPEDVQATLAELTAVTVAEAVRMHAPRTQRLLVCGGGSRNGTIMERLRQHLPGCVVELTDRHGIGAEHVEACAFAWLARQTLHGRAGNLPAVTGARRRVILGGVYQSGREG